MQQLEYGRDISVATNVTTVFIQSESVIFIHVIFFKLSILREVTRKKNHLTLFNLFRAICDAISIIRIIYYVNFFIIIIIKLLS